MGVEEKEKKVHDCVLRVGVVGKVEGCCVARKKCCMIRFGRGLCVG